MAKPKPYPTPKQIIECLLHDKLGVDCCCIKPVEHTADLLMRVKNYEGLMKHDSFRHEIGNATLQTKLDEIKREMGVV